MVIAMKYNCNKCYAFCCFLTEGLKLHKSEGIIYKEKYSDASVEDYDDGQVIIRSIDSEFGKRCYFLNDDFRCSVYDDRPQVCRWFDCDKVKNDVEFMKAKRKHIRKMEKIND